MPCVLNNGYDKYEYNSDKTCLCNASRKTRNLHSDEIRVCIFSIVCLLWEWNCMTDKIHLPANWRVRQHTIKCKIFSTKDLNNTFYQ